MSCDLNNCRFVTNGCTIVTCGDNVVNRDDEECDGNDLAGKTCQSLGFGVGNLGCTNNCAIVTSECTSTAPTTSETQKTCQQTRTLTRRTIGENLCTVDETKNVLRSSYRSCSGRFYKQTCS